MGTYYTYILVLALTVFFIFTALFSVMILYLTKYAMKLIRYGDDDEKILKKRKYIEKTPSEQSKFAKVFSAVLSLILIAIFIFILCISCTENKFDTGLSNIKIVKSTSMGVKNEKNKYLFENDLNDQFAMFDVVLTKELPPENELKLYDIVVYERDDMLVIHRIVKIEEPNEKHSERHFMLQGDAVSRHDVYPVLYSQMKAIYKGDKIPFVGSIMLFIQSPAGWLCFILTLFAIIVSPIVENKLLEEMRKRLLLLDSMPESAEKATQEVEHEKLYEKPKEELIEAMVQYEPDAIRITSVMAEKETAENTVKFKEALPDDDSSIRFIVTDIFKNRNETKLVVAKDEDEQDYNQPIKLKILR